MTSTVWVIFMTVNLCYKDINVVIHPWDKLPWYPRVTNYHKTLKVDRNLCNFVKRETRM